MSGHRSAGTPRFTQFVTTCGVTPSDTARADAPPAFEIADLIAMYELYTKCLEQSNDLFGANIGTMFHNSFMNQVEKINEILRLRELGWADLAREMGLTEQRVNNWRTRGVPAGQLRAVEVALGLKRFALEDDAEREKDVESFDLSPKQRRLVERVATLPDGLIDALQAVIDASTTQPPPRPATAVSAGQKSYKSKSPKKASHLESKT